MESRRARLIIKAHLRGLFNERGYKYHIRSLARKEMILKAMMDEEDAEIAYRAAATISLLISCHVHKLENILSFVDKQMELLNYSANKFAFKNVDLNRSLLPMTEDEIARDYSVLNLIKRFKYMRDNGIIELYFEADRKLFNNY